METTYTKQEVLKILKVHMNTLERYMRRGLIGFIKTGNYKSSHVIFRQSDIDLFIEKNKKWSHYEKNLKNI